MQTMRRFRLPLLALFIVSVFFGVFHLAQFVEQDAAAAALVEQFGYLGVLILAIIAGFNLVVPVPAATFTPIFLAADLNFVAIIAVLVIGTTIADSIGYFIGYFGKNMAAERYPKVHARISDLAKRHDKLILPGVFLYAAFMPLPNEVMLIPLGLLGFRFYLLLVPLILGTIVHQTILAYGFNSIFVLFS